MAVAEVAVGVGALVLVGRSALPRQRPFSMEEIAEDLALGCALAVPVALAWGLAGLPWGPVAMPALALVLAAGLRAVLPVNRAAVVAQPTPRSIASLATAALLVLCLFVTMAKLLSAPLWSWDHFAMWGMKARRLVLDGALDLEFLKFSKLISMNPQYPIGVPLAWRLLSPSMPGSAEFRLSHVLFALALVSALYGCCRRLGVSASVARLAAAALCASPLLWDTENLGLAEVPFACVATVGVLLILRGRDDPDFPDWTAGAVLGFLSWMKTEGFLLGPMLAALAVAGGLPSRAPRRRRAVLLLSCAAWSLVSLAIRRYLLSPGMEFLTGDWAGRASVRLRNPLPILNAMLANLTGREWFALWFLFLLAGLAAWARGASEPRFLSLAILAQFASYGVVYFGTFFGPVEHVQSSFHRLAAGLSPLAILVVVGAFGPKRYTPVKTYQDLLKK